MIANFASNALVVSKRSPGRRKNKGHFEKMESEKIDAIARAVLYCGLGVVAVILAAQKFLF